VHVVKQILCLLSVMSIASCGTMPVPGIDDSDAQLPQTRADNTSSAGGNNVTTKPGEFQNPASQPSNQSSSQSSQRAEPETASLTNAQDIKPNNPQNASIHAPKFNDSQSDSKPLDPKLKEAGLSKERTDTTKQTAQKDELPGNTKQNQTPAKPKQKNPKSDRNQEVRIQLALAKRYYNSAKYQNAIDLLETPAASSKSNEKLQDLLVLTYTKYANELVSKANLLEAQTILEKAVSIEPNNADLQNQLTQVKNTREANRFYQQGLEAINTGNKTKALQSFQRVLVFNPSHSLAKKQVSKIQGSVIESKYKKGMQHYRKQELTDAISAWTDVLEMDPNHELAKLYRSRAVELKLKIDAINR